MDVLNSSITQFSTPSTTSFAGSTSITKTYPDSVRATCDPSIAPILVFNATVPFKNDSPFCQFNFAYHIDRLQYCCGDKPENQVQVYQNCTQYCGLEDDKPTTFKEFRSCLEFAQEDLGYYRAEMHEGVLCGKAKVSGSVKGVGKVGWIQGTVIAAAFLGLML